MNKVILIGNLTRDPELSVVKGSNGDVYVCRFSIAVNRGYKTEDGTQSTDFFNIIAWRNLAETCGKYLAKGKKVSIIASLQNRTYEDKEGIKRYITDIIANEIEFLSANKYADELPTPPPEKKKAGEEQIENKKVEDKPKLIPCDDDMLPF